MTSKKTFFSALLLLGAAFIWGVAFVAQSAGMRYIGPFTFTVVRCLLAAAFLFPCSFFFDRMNGPKETRPSVKAELRAGLLLGLLLFLAVNFQQIGIQYTTAGKAGFITSLYIVIVPVFGLFLKKRVHPVLWLCVLLALIGFYFLSVHEGFSVGLGDLLTLICAFCFAVHILTIDRYAARMNVVRLCCIQFFVTALLSVPFMCIFEEPDMGAILGAWLPLVYAGVLSGGVAYAMQMLGQRHIEPAAASLLCSPESVFAALAGGVLLHERMSPRELLGCALVFLAVVLSQLPWDRLLRRRGRAESCEE
ncbi:MAG: DMT family transporter [Clostridia bacterium]|nr:DMT family transporter [Clostridia bacterium]